MSPQPLLADQEIAYLLDVPKVVADSNWRDSLLNLTGGSTDRRGRLDLQDLPSTGPVRGSLHLYSRENIHPKVMGDWSVGMIFTDYFERSYRVVRCNDPHPSDHRYRFQDEVQDDEAVVPIHPGAYDLLIRRLASEGVAVTVNG